MKDLECNPHRMHLDGTTGVYVRAKLDDRWGNYDIITLTVESLDDLLDSKSREWERALVKILLGQLEDGESG